jgi:hypothetical protein
MADFKKMPTQSIKSIIFIFFLVFFSFSSIRSTSRRFNLQSCCGSRISIVQTLLGQRRSTSAQPNDAPNYRRSRQNQSVRFLKSDCPVSTVLSWGFRFLFVLCGNTFWWLHWGIDYFKHVKHEGWKLWQQRIRPRQGQHHQTHLWHPNRWGLTGVRSLHHWSQRVLPLAARDCSLGYYTDRLPQAQSNTRGMAWPIALSQWYLIYDRLCVRETSKEYWWIVV